jgi:hypothetical protein
MQGGRFEVRVEDEVLIRGKVGACKTCALIGYFFKVRAFHQTRLQHEKGNLRFQRTSIPIEWTENVNMEHLLSTRHAMPMSMSE